MDQLLCYSVGAMALCNYIPQVIFNYVFQLKKQCKLGSIGLAECNGKLMKGLKTLEILWWNSGFSPKMMKMFYPLVISDKLYETSP